MEVVVLSAFHRHFLQNLPKVGEPLKLRVKLGFHLKLFRFEVDSDLLDLLCKVLEEQVVVLPGGQGHIRVLVNLSLRVLLADHVFSPDALELAHHFLEIDLTSEGSDLVEKGQRVGPVVVLPHFDVLDVFVQPQRPVLPVQRLQTHQVDERHFQELLHAQVLDHHFGVELVTVANSQNEKAVQRHELPGDDSLEAQHDVHHLPHQTQEVLGFVPCPFPFQVYQTELVEPSPEYDFPGH